MFNSIIYCQCLDICPKQRTQLEENAFNQGWISLEGYVERAKHRRHLQMHHCCFSSNPLLFIKKLLENRNSFHAPMISHVGSIIYKTVKFSFLFQ